MIVGFGFGAHTPAPRAGRSVGRLLGELARTDAVEAYPDKPLRVVVYRMAEEGFTRIPVVERTTRKLLGLVSLNDLLKARTRHLEEERHRERTLKLRFFSTSETGSSGSADT